MWLPRMTVRRWMLAVAVIALATSDLSKPAALRGVQAGGAPQCQTLFLVLTC